MEKLDHGANPIDVATPKKEFAKELFADMFYYYARNARTLNKDEQEDFKRLDNAANAKQLKEWAENIHVSGGAGDMTGINLANVIRSSDDNFLNELVTEMRQHQRIIDVKAMAITSQVNALKDTNLVPDNNVILFYNGERNFTAVDKDADKVASVLGIMPDRTLKDMNIININSAGLELLKYNRIPYTVVNPHTSLAMVDGKDSETTQENKLMMQMGLLAVRSKGEMVRFDTKGTVFGDEQSLQLKDGLFSATFIAENDKMELLSLPIHKYNTKDGRSESYFSDMAQTAMKNLQAFFNDNFNDLRKTVEDYCFTRKNLDENLHTLIQQNDRLTKENPNTIILIKQKGFLEAFSDSAINVANALNLPLYNRTDHKNALSIPFTRLTVEDYKKLYDSDNNVYLARPSAPDRISDANVTKVNANSIPLAQDNQQQQEQNQPRSFKR